MVLTPDKQGGNWDVLNNDIVIHPHVSSHQFCLAPIDLLDVKAINGVRSKKLLVPLCDACSNGTSIKDLLLPYSCILTTTTTTTTKHKQVLTQDIHKYYQAIFIEHIQLLEFGRACSIQKVSANVFQSLTCPYDVILGMGLLRLIRMQLNCNKTSITTDG